MTQCIKCGKNNFLWIYCDSREENIYKWNDKKEKHGSIPSFGGIFPGRDEFHLHICVECGWIRGLDLTKLKTALKKEWPDKKEKITKYESDSDGSDEDLPKIKMLSHRKLPKK